MTRQIRYLFIDTEGLTERWLTEEEFELGIVLKPGDWDYKKDIKEGLGFAIDIRTGERIQSNGRKIIDGWEKSFAALFTR